MKDTCASLAGLVRQQKPLVHHITNYVTVNDCANMTLAIGASPIMADAIEEAADIGGISSAVVLNMGTLNARTVPAMLAAGAAANARGIPVVFDPVGAGASAFRNETARQIIRAVKVSVLRGNISEIRFIAGLAAETKGVDASDADLHDTANATQIAQRLALELGCVVAITGKEDVVSDGTRTVCIQNGHPMLANLTGTGCMCSSLMGAFCGASPSAPLEAAVSALLTMGIAGELAHAVAGTLGNGSFHTALLDAVSQMDGACIKGRAKLYAVKV